MFPNFNIYHILTISKIEEHISYNIFRTRTTSRNSRFYPWYSPVYPLNIFTTPSPILIIFLLGSSNLKVTGFNSLTDLMATTKIQTEPTWAELLGSKNWENLLDPLDLCLRNHILRCGDLIQATYDAFNNDQNSKYCGASRYGKSSFFDKVMLENASNYKVCFFLYATACVTVPEAFLLHSLSRECWDRESNWIGYVAVNSDEASKASGLRPPGNLRRLAGHYDELRMD